jgi:hypothetical protein
MCLVQDGDQLQCIGRVEIWLHPFFTSALDGGEHLASHPSYVIHRERSQGTHWIGGLVRPRTGLDPVAKRKIPCPSWELNLSDTAHILVTILTELLQLHILILKCFCFLLAVFHGDSVW